MFKAFWCFCGLSFLVGTLIACEGETFIRKEPSKLLVNTDLLDFGPVITGANLGRNLTFTAHGIEAIEVSTLNIATSDAPFHSEESSVTVNGNSDRKVQFFYAPKNAGEHEASLTVTADASNASDISITLKGQAFDEFICGDCSSPPEDFCINAISLLVYTNVGECVDDQCQYQATIEECEFGCHEPTATCNGASVECEDSDCDDSVFCNGIETCNENFCESGEFPCASELPFCDEDNDACVACTENAHCDDLIFCNGAEVCTAGVCGSGATPCDGDTPLCDEDNDVCVVCTENAHCDDQLFCNGAEVCTAGACVSGEMPCFGDTPLCDEETDTCTGCSESDPCSEICMAQCTGHCWCLKWGNNFISVPFIFPNNDSTIQTLFGDDRFNFILGGRQEAFRENGVWTGALAAAPGILAKESYWLNTNEEFIWSVPGIPDFGREYQLFHEVEGLLADCSTEAQSCAGLICSDGQVCNNRVNWVSFPGLASQPLFNTSELVGAIPPEVEAQIETIQGGNYMGLFRTESVDGDGGVMTVSCENNGDCSSLCDDGVEECYWKCLEGQCMRWSGNLTTMEPLTGYKILVKEDISFQFNIDTTLPENAVYATE